MPPSTAFPGPGNVYIPAFQGKQTADLVMSFARDPKRFAVNKLAQRVPTQTLAGNFLQLRPEVLARVISDPNEVIWVDGMQRPIGTHNQQDFRALPYQCQRRQRPAYLGWQTKDQAVWSIQDTQLQVLGHQMMTQRAFAFYNLTLTAANHLSTHVATATAWSTIGGTGGFWSAGTTANPIIKRSLLNMANQIRKDTMDTVSYKDLTLVISPPAAIAMADSQEIHNYLSNAPMSLQVIRGDESVNAEWGLPDRLYGFNLVVDGSLRTTSPRLMVPGTTLDIMDDNTALVMALPGDLKDNIGQVNSAFASVGMFVYRGEEMVIETQDEPWNKRTLMSCFETYDFRALSVETMALATNLFA